MLGWLLVLINFKYRLLVPGLLYLATIWGATIYAYLRNAKLPSNSPYKRQYHPIAIAVAPFTLPFFLAIGAFLYIVVLIIRSILFGIFLLVFPFVLIFFRNLGLINWLLKQFERLGHALLKINTFVFRLAGFPPPRLA